MMPKVLIVTNEPLYTAQWIAAALRNLGISYDLAYGESATDNLQTPQGSLSPSTSACRNFLRQYDAVLIARRNGHLADSLSLAVAAHWLGWNDPDDPPLLYFGLNFSVAVTALNTLLPSDFPLIRPNNANLADTVAVSDNGFPSFGANGAQAGVVSFFLREGVELITPAVCAYLSDNRTTLWRYNPTQHATLANQTYTHRIALNSRAGELLVTPATQPDESYPNNTVIAYRYKNCVFLPMLRAADRLFERQRVYSFTIDLFWLLYGLKIAGVQPERALPIFFETDHPLERVVVARADGLTDIDIVNAETALCDYFRDFHRRNGMVTHHGITTSGIERGTPTPTEHWKIVHATRYGGSTALEQAGQRCHDVLLAGHREGSAPCGCHDHSIFSEGWWALETRTDFRRHQSTNYDSPYSPAGLSFPREAPNDVRIRKGNCCVRKAHSPVQTGQGDAEEIDIGGETYVEWNYPSGSTTGSATQFELRMGSLQAAMMVIESNIAELQALGFPDGHGGEHGYTNTAGNYSGGPCYWEAARRMGHKALRSSYRCNGAPSERVTVPPNRVWNGFHLIPELSIDIVQNIGSNTISYGLYRAGASNSQHAVGRLGLDNSGDITSNYPNTARRAHRRTIATLIGRWLMFNALHLGGAYIHPTSWTAWNTQTPLARFDGVLEYVPGYPHWNGVVELLENMAVIVGVLSDYLKFGSVSDTIAIRERVL